MTTLSPTNSFDKGGQQWFSHLQLKKSQLTSHQRYVAEPCLRCCNTTSRVFLGVIATHSGRTCECDSQRTQTSRTPEQGTRHGSKQRQLAPHTMQHTIIPLPAPTISHTRCVDAKLTPDVGLTFHLDKQNIADRVFPLAA
jgi:hypothetical protein